MAEEPIIENELELKEGVVCLPSEFEVVIPDECIERCPDAYGKIRSKMLETFGGVTTTNSVGAWYDDNNKPIVEPVKIIKSSHGCITPEQKRELKKEIGLAGQMSNQQAIFIKDNKAWIIPPKHLLSP